MIEALFARCVGDCQMSPTDFYSLTIGEAILISERYISRVRENYFLTYIAVNNAVGPVYAGKKFKIKHPFEMANQQIKPIINKENRDATLAFIKERIKAGEQECL